MRDWVDRITCLNPLGITPLRSINFAQGSAAWGHWCGGDCSRTDPLPKALAPEAKEAMDSAKYQDSVRQEIVKKPADQDHLA
jgi:hypothetical protein